MNAWEDKEGLYLLKRLKIEGYLSKYPTQSKKLSDFENAEIWIKEVTATTVNFFKERPHLKFIDVCIEDIQTPKLLANFFKIPKINLEHDNTGHYDGYQYYGYHLIQFENDRFHNGKIYLDKKEISEENLINFLTFKNL